MWEVRRCNLSQFLGQIFKSQMWMISQNDPVTQCMIIFSERISFATTACAISDGELGPLATDSKCKGLLSMPRVCRGTWRRWAAPRAQRPRTKSAPSAPRPRAPLASWSQGHQPDLFCPGLTRGLGWHAWESCAGAARHARHGACSIACLRAAPHTQSVRVHMLASLAHNAVLNVVLMEHEQCFASVHTQVCILSGWNWSTRAAKLGNHC